MPKRVNILIVDDLADKLLALRAVLEDLDQNLVTVMSGREALRQVSDKEFAVILLDVNMPDMDGFETAALIRQRRRSAHTPIIFITAFGDEMHTSRGYSLGAVDYILSPVMPDILRTKVGVFVELYKNRMEVERHAEERIELARIQAERASAELSSRRSRFLSDASRVLGGSLNIEDVMPAMAEMVASYFGGMSGVILAPDFFGRAQTEVAWRNLDAVRHRSIPREFWNPTLLDAVTRIASTGQERAMCFEDAGLPPATPLWGVEIADQELSRTARGLESGIFVPLSARGLGLGVLILAREKNSPSISPDDRNLAQDLASRAAFALDNARLYRNIQEADRRKDDFLAMLAHELRNPLAPIRNAIHVLRQGQTNAQNQAWAHEVIERQVHHLVRLVDDLLDVSRITRGKILLQQEPVQVRDVLTCAIEASSPLFAERQLHFEADLPDESLVVIGDRTRLAQTVTNILNNAAKYTDSNGSIELKAERDADHVVIKIRDSGIGIPSEYLDRIFEVFFQVNPSLARLEGGLGIGLTVVHRLVQMHGGTITVESSGANQGSEFAIRLPLAMPSSTGVGKKQSGGVSVSTSEQREPEACRVLIVDDNRDAADSLACVLEHYKHVVKVAHDGQTALGLAESFQPNVALLDIGLPVMDGYELTRRFRKEPWASDLFIVAITGYGQETDKARAHAAGCDRHLVKPVMPEVLLQVLNDIRKSHHQGAKGLRSNVAAVSNEVASTSNTAASLEV